MVVSAAAVAARPRMAARATAALRSLVRLLIGKAPFGLTRLSRHVQSCFSTTNFAAAAALGKMAFSGMRDLRNALAGVLARLARGQCVKGVCECRAVEALQLRGIGIGEQVT